MGLFYHVCGGGEIRPRLKIFPSKNFGLGTDSWIFSAEKITLRRSKLTRKQSSLLARLRSSSLRCELRGVLDEVRTFIMLNSSTKFSIVNTW